MKKHGDSCLKKIKTSGSGHQQNGNCHMALPRLFVRGANAVALLGGQNRDPGDAKTLVCILR